MKMGLSDSGKLRSSLFKLSSCVVCFPWLSMLKNARTLIRHAWWRFKHNKIWSMKQMQAGNTGSGYHQFISKYHHRYSELCWDRPNTDQVLTWQICLMSRLTIWSTNKLMTYRRGCNVCLWCDRSGHVTQHNSVGSHHNLHNTERLHIQHMYRCTTLLTAITIFAAHNPFTFNICTIA